jgi:alkanesulfonate monooxygenase SsuD/methylene tetrahydromethanopterin reductase-like flavin-dependent oxidoreductase (luciferase family)
MAVGYGQYMRFSVWSSPTRSIDEILDIAKMADDNDWHGVWFADHYMPNTEDGSISDGDTHEAWGVLPAIAATTSRVRLGPLVSPTSVHHPALLANRAITIDHISHGRFVLGLGAGWQINEHRAYGIELEPPRQRVDRFAEALTIIKMLMSQPRTTFDGDIYRITDAPCEPKAIQDAIPILVGTGGSRMMRLTARHADEWNTWGSPATVADRLSEFLQACETVARDPDTIWTSAQTLMFITDSDEATKKALAAAPAGRAVAGTIAELVEIVGQFADLGIDELIIPDFSLGKERAERREAFEMIRSEIMPAYL